MKSTTKAFSRYIRVDNGGWKIAVEVDCNAEHPKSASIIIEDSYFGYSATTLRLNSQVTPQNLRNIAEQFILAARELES